MAMNVWMNEYGKNAVCEWFIMNSYKATEKKTYISHIFVIKTEGKRVRYNKKFSEFNSNVIIKFE